MQVLRSNGQRPSHLRGKALRNAMKSGSQDEYVVSEILPSRAAFVQDRDVSFKNQDDSRPSQKGVHCLGQRSHD